MSESMRPPAFSHTDAIGADDTGRLRQAAFGEKRRKNTHYTPLSEADRELADGLGQMLWNKKEAKELSWRDIVDVATKMQNLKSDASESQDFAEIKFPDATTPLLFVPFSDWHIGSFGSDHNLMQEFVDIVKKYNLRTAWIGDMTQMSIKLRGVLEVVDNVLTPDLQMIALEDFAEEVKDYTLWSTWDNHCHVEGTEFLTRRGWLSYQDITEQDALASFGKDGNITFSKPLSRYSGRYTGQIHDFEAPVHRQVVTGNHHIVLRNADGSYRKVMAKDAPALTADQLVLAGSEDKADYPVSDDLLRVLVWTCMDGTIAGHRKSDRSYRIQFKLSKERKIQRLSEILTSWGASFTVREQKKAGANILTPYYIRFYADWSREIVKYVGREKNLPDFFLQLSRRQVEIVLRELVETDGTQILNTIRWSSANKQHVDVMQAMLTQNSYRMWYKVVPKETGGGFANRADLFVCSISPDIPARKDVVSHRVCAYDGNVYCFTMPCGTLITRYDGKTAFSGNSVMREENAVGFSRYASIWKKRTVWFSGIGHIDLTVGKETYKLAASHFFRGRSMINPTHGQARYARMEANDRECIIAGDSHVPGYAKFREGGTLRVAINCGTIQTNSGYGKRFFSILENSDFPCAMFWPDRHIITPFWTVGEMLYAAGKL